MNYQNPEIYSTSDPALVAMLGRFIKSQRLQQNKSQQEIADFAGINRTTLIDLENGRGCTLITFVRLLRALDRLALLDVFFSQPQFSPMQLARLEMKKRRRASGSKVKTGK